MNASLMHTNIHPTQSLIVMNWKYLFMGSMGLWLATFILLNCMQPQQPSAEKALTRSAPSELSDSVQTCTMLKDFESTPEPDPVQISCSGKLEQLAAYDSLLQKLQSSIDLDSVSGSLPVGEASICYTRLFQELMILKGFSFSRSEVESLLAVMPDSSDYRLHVRFAVNPIDQSHDLENCSPGEFPTKVDYLDAYLIAETQAGSGQDVSVVIKDFPKPCPAMCLNPTD